MFIIATKYTKLYKFKSYQIWRRIDWLIITTVSDMLVASKTIYTTWALKMEAANSSEMSINI